MNYAQQADEHQLLIVLFSCNGDKYNNGLMFTFSNSWIAKK